VSLGKLVTRNLGHVNIDSRCNAGAACQNTPIPEKRIERKQTEDGEGKYKRKREELGSDEKRKVAGKEKEGNRDKEKIHKADMVNRKNTEVQGKCEVAKTGG